MVKKSNKGFTLIELLTIIILIAIISLIAAPQVIHMIEKARKNTTKSNVIEYVKAIEQQIMDDELDEIITVPDGTYYVDDIEVDYSGQGPSEGLVTIEKQKVTSAKLCMGKYSMNYADSKVTFSKSDYCKKSFTVTLNVNGTKQKSTLNGSLSTTFSADVSGMTNISCNNGAVPSVEGNTITINNVFGNTTCKVNTSLKKTINSLDNEEANIVMLRNEEINEKLTINKNVTVNLDLKNYSITNTSQSTSNKPVVDDNISFFVEGKLNISATVGSIGGFAHAIFVNGGELSINGGSYNSIGLKNSTANLSNFSAKCTVEESDCYAIMTWGGNDIDISHYTTVLENGGKAFGMTNTTATSTASISDSNLSCLKDNCVWFNGGSNATLLLNKVTINSYGYSIANSTAAGVTTVKNSTFHSGVNNDSSDVYAIIISSGVFNIDSTKIYSDNVGRGIRLKEAGDVNITNCDFMSYKTAVVVSDTVTETSTMKIKNSRLTSEADHTIYLNSDSLILKLYNNKIVTKTSSALVNLKAANITISSGRFNVVNKGYQGAISNRSSGTINICSATVNGISTLYDLWNDVGTINYNSSKTILLNNKTYNNTGTLNPDYTGTCK